MNTRSYSCRQLYPCIVSRKNAAQTRVRHNSQKKQAAADVLFNYSKFVMACIGNGVRPCDLRLHLIKEISGIQTSLAKESSRVPFSPDAMGESSSSGTRRFLMDEHL